jgi:hypothetical protein
VVPPAYQIVDPLSQPPEVIYYYVVETGNQGGTGTQTLDMVESATGKVFQQLTAPVTLPANSTNLLGWSGSGVPNHDGYAGAEELVFTTTFGANTVQGRAYLWMLPQQ